MNDAYRSGAVERVAKLEEENAALRARLRGPTGFLKWHLLALLGAGVFAYPFVWIALFPTGIHSGVQAAAGLELAFIMLVAAVVTIGIAIDWIPDKLKEPVRGPK